MKSQYKLVVVTPFNDYQRGDEITDQSVIDNILDAEHEMHHHESHVRRVTLENQDQDKNKPDLKEEDKNLTLSTIKDESLSPDEFEDQTQSQDQKQDLKISTIKDKDANKK